MITINTEIKTGDCSKAVDLAAQALKRDIENTCLASGQKGVNIALLQDKEVLSECFKIRVENLSDGKKINIAASDDFGLIYGLFHVSKVFLGVNEFWFWNQQIFEKKEGYPVPDSYSYDSRPFRVRYRGWFINDEVLFDGWIEGKDPEMPWRMAFEAMLRCGGNMTIPGTDFNAHKYKKLAGEYGLYITHHHAEPMGARMFARAYPELDASYDKYPELFKGLWEEAIEDQKDLKVIWNIGFRGQGDRPFWIDDPAYETNESRGKLMSDLMLLQYNMIREKDPEAVCCMNLYGEIMELYRDGFMKIPEDVIKIWADNGFGKMVSRRQNNHNPRVYALPDEKDKSAHGIYYHASFYDLQAAAMMTMLPNSPAFVLQELSKVLEKGADDFWIINCSNVKPHAYYLELISRIWRGETDIENVDEAAAKALADNFAASYCSKYFAPQYSERIAELFKLWPEYAVSYGPNADDHAGEQFCNHGSRILACAFISGFDKTEPGRTKATPELNWLIQKDTLLEQVKWHLDKFEEAVIDYREYLGKCLELKAEMEKDAADRAAQLDDTLIVQVQYLYYSYLGAYHICKALVKCLDSYNSDGAESFIGALEEAGEGRNIDYLGAFYEAGIARKAFYEGYSKMRAHEQGIWENFYKNDCEADIRQSYHVAESLMSYLRVLGDGPHFYKWQRHFQKGAGGDKVHLILRVKAHLSDLELWELMEEQQE